MRFRLRKYSADDHEAIPAFFMKRYMPCAAGTIPKSSWMPGRRQKSTRRWCEALAQEGGKIVGLGNISGDYPDRLYAHKDHRHEGIGAALADALEEHARMQGEREITAFLKSGDFSLSGRSGCIEAEKSSQIIK